MIMKEKLLEELGLTTNESKVYLTLLRIGKSQTGQIIKKAKISSGKIYETLEKLIAKGLVQFVIENNVKQFCTTDPKSLLSYMEDKKEIVLRQEIKVKELLPEFTQLYIETQEEDSVSLLKGLKGVKPIVYDVLDYAKKSGQEVLVMGVRPSKNSRFNIFWQHWHRARVDMKVSARVLFSGDLNENKKSDYWKFFVKLSRTKVRDNHTISPSAILIVGKHSFIFSYDGTLHCIHSTTPSIAESFSSFFEDVWEHAEK